MSNLRKIIVWFLICLVLATYVKSSGMSPGVTLGSRTQSSQLGLLTK